MEFRKLRLLENYTEVNKFPKSCQYEKISIESYRILYYSDRINTKQPSGVCKKKTFLKDLTSNTFCKI